MMPPNNGLTMSLLLPQASRASLAAAVAALAPSLDLGAVFSGAAPGGAPEGSRYALRTVVCYFHHHYKVLLLATRAYCPAQSQEQLACCKNQPLQGLLC